MQSLHFILIVREIIGGGEVEVNLLKATLKEISAVWQMDSIGSKNKSREESKEAVMGTLMRDSSLYLLSEMVGEWF